MCHPVLPFRVGDKASLSKTVTDKDIVSFAELVGDYNPIHIDEEYARNGRFGGRVAHGALTIGLISAVLGNKMPGPGTIYLSQSIRFVRPVRPGDTITATVEMLEIDAEKRVVRLRTDCVNQAAKTVAEGEAVVLVDEGPKGLQ